MAELFCLQETFNQMHFQKSDCLTLALAFGLHVGGSVTTGERDMAPPDLLHELQAEQKAGVGRLQGCCLENVGKHGAGGRRRQQMPINVVFGSGPWR